ncbi:phosphotransferase [Saccharothrix australiensis]|uniref:phosphotransferase n=1 Tax=Saccharothrix australiensis TaxID=2072 RepID=UPI001B85B58F|nr:phosphotransferase [Saccharothrix australiensis]
MVHLRPAPVVARVGAVTSMVRGDVHEHFHRADSVARFLAGRGVPVVEPLLGPIRWDGLVVSFASYVEHDAEWRPDPASFAAMLAELHAELRHYPGALPAAAPLADIDAVLALAGRPADLVRARDGLAARWPDLPGQALHGDSHPRNVLFTARGPVWNDFEDAWFGPVGWDVACAARGPLLARDAVARAYPVEGLSYWLELRELFGRCWRLALDLHRDGPGHPARVQRSGRSGR